MTDGVAAHVADTVMVLAVASTNTAVVVRHSTSIGVVIAMEVVRKYFGAHGLMATRRRLGSSTVVYDKSAGTVEASELQPSYRTYL